MKRTLSFIIAILGLGTLNSCNCIFASRSVIYQLMQDVDKDGTTTASGSISDITMDAGQTDSGKVDLTK